MRAKEFFAQVKDAEEKLKMLNEKIQHWEELGFSMGGMASGSGNRHNATSRVELAACGAADVLTDIQERRAAYLALISRAEGIIEKIPQERYRKLLDYHYLCGKSLKWVSDELDYTGENSIYKAHGYALAEAQKVMDQE